MKAWKASCDSEASGLVGAYVGETGLPIIGPGEVGRPPSAVEWPWATSAGSRSSWTNVVTFVFTVSWSPKTQLTGLEALAHPVRSFPPMDTVTRPTFPG